MSKKLMITIIVCFVTTFIGRTTYSITLDLNSSQINEAIEYGKENRRLNLKDFIKPWVVLLDEKTGWATLYTPYHNLAFKAKKAAVERRELDQREISNALRIKESLTFTVSVFGDYMEFARGYNAVIFFGEKAIYPIFAYFPEYAEPSKFYPNPPVYVAGCVFKFPTEDIEPNSVITLLVTSPEGEQLKFVFDLAKVK